jgi:hypothetical protein
VRDALARECKVPKDRPVGLSVRGFVPQALIPRLVSKLEPNNGADAVAAFSPRITPLECVQPWNYRSWNHWDSETDKSKSSISEATWS